MNLFIIKAWMDAKFHKGEEGASLTEYALLVALIAVAAIIAINFLSGGISGKLNEAGNALQ